MTLRSTTDTLLVDITERSQVASARRAARKLARTIDFDEAAIGQLELLVTEAASNQLRHAGTGMIALTCQREGEQAWIEILALDSGPGIVQLGRALAGGSSSSGGLGQGLGAIRRLADHFSIFAPKDRGTALLARVGSMPPADGPCLVSGLGRGLKNQPVSGDGWGARQVQGDKTLLFVLDGVGHGPEAHDAVERGLATLARIRRPTATQLLRQAHRSLVGSRGAAGLAILLDPCEGRLSYAGLGNIRGTLVLDNERRQGLVSLNGTLGRGSPMIEEFEREWPQGGVLVVQTDGVSSGWELAKYRGLWRQDPALIAGVLFRDHARTHDDATVVAARCPEIRI